MEVGKDRRENEKAKEKNEEGMGRGRKGKKNPLMRSFLLVVLLNMTQLALLLQPRCYENGQEAGFHRGWTRLIYSKDLRQNGQISHDIGLDEESFYLLILAVDSTAGHKSLNVLTESSVTSRNATATQHAAHTHTRTRAHAHTHTHRGLPLVFLN